MIEATEVATKLDGGQQQQLESLVSSPEKVEELAAELAEDYVKYLFVDTTEQQNKVESSIEECLAHLEEICSVLDGYRQKSGSIGKFVKTMKSKSDTLEDLYKHVDAVEQYTNETNNLLDQLDELMKDLEINSKSNRNGVKQIMDMLPKISLGLQRFNLFGNIGGFLEQSRPAYLDDSVVDEEPTIPIEEILQKVSVIRHNLEVATSHLEAELGSFTTPLPVSCHR